MTYTQFMYNVSMSKNIETRFVGPDVVAKYMGVSRNTVVKWAREGVIPSLKIEKTYRFCPHELSDALGKKVLF